ncbi:hypothetical protein BpOF4_16485 [Alkalihalophilus pseudofirmus OF4]|uniref:Ribosomal protein L7/L12 C-terminal domain-containing protein n=1 Tax=Alkalihalophilus pseudofirmus (strain ATCC BAA-2126 / JCM 17055 / OF4) TaxID=398511 RepID=D3FQ49_ALKPO|nr:hypothetical protein [Alkalihalophilus pseudofirmus]ADC51342.1 hypothetical protein BpOF4_16485 [Alkalihalophilus pseudofirmus OF4]
MDYIILFILSFILLSISTTDRRLKKIEYKLDQISDQVGVTGLPVDDEIRELLKKGQRVEAVKLARDELGLSLVEGKKYVDGLSEED